ncbi:hypothetical protein KH172YL63_12420 [Bacillus sp. KH172YL63]|nr:hypothetical protein KH172YL63_12420 [Bacillus sp. KH172YL63]
MPDEKLVDISSDDDKILVTNTLVHKSLKAFKRESRDYSSIKY